MKVKNEVVVEKGFKREVKGQWPEIATLGLTEETGRFGWTM
jgi:hypothetical protein